MNFLKRQLKSASCCLALIVLFFSLSSCDSLLKQDTGKAPLARVGDTYLYKEDVSQLLGDNISEQDSASFVTNYINNWATKQLLLEKAKINLPEEKLANFEQLVADYRTDLYTRAYKEALVQQAEDTTISSEELEGFYEKEKENFKLKEKLVKLRFIQLPTQFMNKTDVIDRLKRFNEEDRSYLDSIGVQFKKLNFNDSLWVPASRVIEEIPPMNYDNEDRYLKKSQFFELEDAMGVYLAKVLGVLQVNDIAPLNYIEPTIRQVLLNRRKLDYIRKLETEIIDEATKENEFEVYENQN
ncbi:peptidyl-prolyl cis-trans isomerase [Muriicola sp. Z0-33]|uniref:peptidyl-prolyl cis-trans isomerase n=1 Tax=Muriicola sp. Z0-33 TaxID=2816957 RepID=UPI0022386A17|nr:peptidyl-prolyl cis-trans isomerase [Muriicola sp. Z0-33]MCW5517352.1 peptidyl-prolyl cis-trans isomerase [Muriicola sp. Z0-33]